MALTAMPSALACAECEAEVEDLVYLPAHDQGGEYDPVPEAAVCTDCGFTEVGFAGCAPEPGDLLDADDAVLLQVDVVDDGVEIVSVKD